MAIDFKDKAKRSKIMNRFKEIDRLETDLTAIIAAQTNSHEYKSLKIYGPAVTTLAVDIIDDERANLLKLIERIYNRQIQKLHDEIADLTQLNLT